MNSVVNRWFQGVNNADVDCQSQENPTARPSKLQTIRPFRKSSSAFATFLTVSAFLSRVAIRSFDLPLS